MILRGAEIFTVGTWPGSVRVTLDEEDLDGIVSAFDALNLAGRVPLKLTHEGPDQERSAINGDGGWNPAKSLAMGWVQRVWRDGKKLMADLDVPEKVHKLIKQGFLKFVSVELLRQVQAFNRVIPWVLDAVALLGADQPAVGILSDLQALTLARRAPVRLGRHGDRVTLRRGSQSEDSDMNEEDVKKLLAKQQEDNDAKFAALTSKLTASEKRAEDAEKARADEAKARKADATKFKRESIDALFNRGIADKAIDPKVREQFAKFSRYDKDDAACDAVDVKDVEAYIKENSKPVKASAKVGTETGGDDADVSKLSIDRQVEHHALKWCRDHNVDGTDPANLANAGVAVLRADKDLAAKYQRLHVKGGEAA